MDFSKLEALGNDFILIDERNKAALPDPAVLSDLADRRRGIGFDQALVLQRSSDSADFAVRIFNANSSEAEQCGNGMRAIAAWLDGRGELGSGRHLQTLAGVVSIAPAGAERYTAELPGVQPPAADMEQLPIPEIDAPAGPAQLVSLGNPHLVVAWPRPPTADELAAVVEQVSSDPRWNGRVNIGLAAQIEEGARILLRVHERGAGPTPACGSGACAAALLFGRSGMPIQVDQPGGSLVINWQKDHSRVRTQGPARLIFHGSTA